MKYRMTINPALELGNKTITYGFETAEQMKDSQEVAAGLLLFLQDEMKVMDDYSNIFFLEELINDEWEEYEAF